MEELNQDLINQIYNIYEFKVDYGPKAGGLYFQGRPCVMLKSHEKANVALKSLVSSLPIFPKNFFRTFQGQNGYRITLFDDIPGNVAGFASYEFGDDNRMVIDVNSDFLGRVFSMKHFTSWKVIFARKVMENPILLMVGAV